MYRWTFLLTGIAAVLLGVLLLVRPDLYFQQYMIPDADVEFAARRLSPAIIALGALMIVLRKLHARRKARAIALIGAATWCGIALTGVHAYVTGQAEFNIMVAAATEIALAGAFALSAAEKW